MQFITRQRRRPFFAYIPFNTPHSPMQVPDRFYRRFAGRDLPLRAADRTSEDLEMTRAAFAMVENIDWNVGRMLDHLDRLQLSRDTIVIYFSDNGPAAARWNGGLKGRKGSLDEGGIRSPFLIRWPGRIRPGTTIPQIASAVDLLPTLADLAGIRSATAKPLDGRSLEPLLLGAPEPWPDRTLFAFGVKGQVSVRTQRFRRDPAGQLFDLVADPGQGTDVAWAHPTIATELGAAAERMGRLVAAGIGTDDRPLPVGGARRVELPAGDATMTGSIQRSNRFPNSSYFTAWTGTDAVISWDVEVLQPGDYEVVAYYACPPDDVGSTIEVAFAEQRLTATIATAHDPPLIGAAEDRVPRIESYVKDFKPLSLGRIRLDARRGPLTMRARRVAGRQALELWSLVLTRR
jgi:Sulfatase